MNFTNALIVTVTCILPGIDRYLQYINKVRDLSSRDRGSWSS